MKINNYILFIEEHFTSLSNQNDMEWNSLGNEYLRNIENKTTLITLNTFNREEGINITIVNKEKNEYYTIGDIIDERVGDNSYLSEEDRQKCFSFGDKIKVSLYVASLILENYCQDMLSGDFTEIGPGTPN